MGAAERAPATLADLPAQLEGDERFDMVLVMAGGNVGNAPFFVAPASWLMTWRSRRLHAFVNGPPCRSGSVRPSSWTDEPRETEAPINKSLAH